MATLNAEQKKYFLSLTPDDITAELIVDLFADKVYKENGKMKYRSKFNTYDTFTLDKDEYFNKEKILTNVGLFIYNKFLFEKSLYKIMGYVNETITEGVYNDIESKLKGLLDDKITVEDYIEYLDKTQWLGMQFNPVFAGTFSMKTLKPLPKVMKERDKLFKENKEAIDNGDVIAAAKIEEKLIKLAKEELDGNNDMDVFKHGQSSFKNNYKNISIMKGPMKDLSTGKYKVAKSNFIEGIKKDELVVYANSVVAGQYPKSVGTQVSGAMSKQLTAAFQTISLDKPNSDCKTKGYLEIVVTPWTKIDVVYNYMIEGNKYVLIDDSNVDKYMGKKIKLRNPMFCVNDKLCRICAGVMFDKLEITHIGLTTSRIASTLLNASMKKFHDSTVSVNKIDLNTITL